MLVALYNHTYVSVYNYIYIYINLYILYFVFVCKLRLEILNISKKRAKKQILRLKNILKMRPKKQQQKTSAKQANECSKTQSVKTKQHTE